MGSPDCNHWIVPVDDEGGADCNRSERKAAHTYDESGMEHNRGGVDHAEDAACLHA